MHSYECSFSIPEEEMTRKAPDAILPKPKLLHHIVEDFLTSWDAPTSHVLPLRRFLEGVVGSDLREYFSEVCLKIALTHEDVPYSCQQHFMQGQGLVPTYSLQELAQQFGLLAWLSYKWIIH